MTLVHHRIRSRQESQSTPDLCNFYQSILLQHSPCHDCPDVHGLCVFLCFIWLWIFGKAVSSCIHSVITAIKETKATRDKQLAINDTSLWCNSFPIHQSNCVHVSLPHSAIRLPVPDCFTTAFSGEELLGWTKGID